jgi:SAM-dependent methyltransferase
MSNPASTDWQALKARLKATWEAGDYGRFARYLEPGALEILQRLAIAPGSELLDVGCGAGQTAIPAAQAGVRVTGVDIAANLISQARERAAALGLAARSVEGDAEELPFHDGAFDVVLSLIGAMFAPRPERVASELVRVCRRGGRIVMINWTPEGFIGRLFGVIGHHLPPPAGVPSPMAWGDEAVVRERLRNGIAELRLTRHDYPLRWPFAPAQVVDWFGRWYGPIVRAFEALGDARGPALRDELEALFSAHNRARDGSTAIDAEYLQVDAIRA